MSTPDWRPNDAQARAIAHQGGPLRLQAGAGSGKTTTLVRRIAALVAAGQCRPGEVLMLTFTTKAVADMRARVGAQLGGTALPRVETYHAFALALVQEFAHLLGLPPDPVLLTAGPVRLFARLHLDRLGLQGLDLTRLDGVVDQMLEFSAWHRHEGTFRQPEADLLARLGPEADPDRLREFLAGHTAYRALLKEKGAADYDDLIALAVELLEQHEAVRAAVHGRYRHLLVDEYQDTDYLQGRFVQLLAPPDGGLTVVGDPDQTIYSFRGAALSNILDFHREFAGVTTIPMAISYRSTPEIVAAANRVIWQNTRRKPDALVSDRPSGQRPLLVTAPDFPAEAAWIAAEARRRHDAGTPWADLAILVRWNKHKLPLYTALQAAAVPALVVGGLDLFSDAETVRLICYLRALAAPEQDGDLMVALGLPRYGLTDRDLAALARHRERRRQPLLTAVTARAAADPRLRLFLDEFWPLYALQFTAGPLAAMRQAIDLHAGSLSLRARLAAGQLPPLAEGFLAHPELFVSDTAATPLALFCEYLDGLRDAGDSPEGVPIDEDADAVRLMTVHAAKGLEFPVVFVPRLTERDFHPKGRKWDKPFPLAWHHDPGFAADFAGMQAEEERRLFYVAVTRARERLYLSWAPADPDRKKPVGPSQFVAEVSPACEAVTLPPAALPAAATADVDALLAPVCSDRPAAPLAAAPAPAALAPASPAVLSFSALSTYQTCPYRYYLQWVLRLPGRPAPAADLGVRVHAAIERLAAVRSHGEAVDFGAFAGWAEAEAAGAADDAEAEDAAPGEPAPDLAAALANYWASEYAQLEPVAVEQEFHVALGGAVIRGFIDRVHRRADGTLAVVDFKTYSRLLPEAEVRAGLQLPLYIKACREALGLDVSTGALYFLRHGEAVRVRYSEAELQERWQEAERLVTLVRAGEHQPTPGAVCGWCPYGEVCPVAAASGGLPGR